MCPSASPSWVLHSLCTLMHPNYTIGCMLFPRAVSTDVNSPGLPRDAAALESSEVNLGDVLKSIKEGSAASRTMSGSGSGSGTGAAAAGAAVDGSKVKKVQVLCQDGTEDAAYMQLAEVCQMHPISRNVLITWQLS